MYGAGRRHGLGIYGAGRRHGLGMYGAGRRHGLGMQAAPDDGGVVYQDSDLPTIPDTSFTPNVVTPEPLVVDDGYQFLGPETVPLPPAPIVQQLPPIVVNAPTPWALYLSVAAIAYLIMKRSS